MMDLLLYAGWWPFEKFLGFVFFLIMAMVGFWCLTFLIGFVPYWLTYGVAESYDKINADVDPETVRRKTLPEQEGVEVIYKR